MAGFKCYVKPWEWQMGLGGQTAANMIEGLAVFPASNENVTSSHPTYPYQMAKFN